MFTRHVLRTTDPDAAARFYDTLLGPGEREIELLPPEIRARGAVPHWLGHLPVTDVEVAVAAWLAEGATRRGPTRPFDGGSRAILADPGGAGFAVSDATQRSSGVAWAALNTAGVDRVVAAYVRHGVAPGFFAQDIAGRPGVHPHWLFFFAVPDLDAAIATVRASGGIALAPLETPHGRLVACDDPQGAAFGLLER